MSTRPPLTENADAPLSSDELEDDRAASPQDTDPLDRPDLANTSLPASEGHMSDDPDDSSARSVEADITLLPPG